MYRKISVWGVVEVLLEPGGAGGRRECRLVKEDGKVSHGAPESRKTLSEQMKAKESRGKSLQPNTG